MLELSNRKLKAFDRRGGAYLVLPWPEGLARRDAGLSLDEERAASSAEHLAAMRVVAPIVQQYGVIHLGTQVALLCGPYGREPSGPTLWLLAHLVTPRWQRATTRGQQAPLQWVIGEASR